MYKYIIASFILIVFLNGSYAQIKPAENDTLNYRLAGFSVPANSKAVKYRYEVALGYLGDDETSEKQYIVKKESTTNKVVILLPLFNQSYIWRVTLLDKNNKVITRSQHHQFFVGTNIYLDTSKYRVKVINNAVTAKDMYVFFDNTRTLRDMDGNIVWYLPAIPGQFNEAEMIRDLKATDHGTITFMTNRNGYEIDYDANILWQTPNDGKISNDTVEHYHHQFDRMRNGHYMVAANEKQLSQITNQADTTERNIADLIEKKNGKIYKKSTFGVIIEYDSAGKIVWVWRSGEYFSKVNYATKGKGGKIRGSTHFNAFYYDERNQFIYASFRDVSRVLKVSYPSGKVVACYGESDEPDADKMGKGFFYAQHNCGINKDGDLMLFNNNVLLIGGAAITTGRMSSVLIMKEPDNQAEALTKKWEFTCDIDTFAPACGSGGGSVSELKDGSLLVCMGSVSRNFIVTKEKKIIWNSIAQLKANDTWISMAGYRVSPIESDEKMIKIIFH